MTAIALMMVLVPKYSLLAYNLEDGATDVAKLTDEQKRFRITEDLGFLDYLGYLCFLPTSLVGPPLEYRDYKYYMDGAEVYGSIPAK
jgi:D-alanyl-lipoteichoic acid acyltransferase DltB (MBOAT superfamily)